MRLPLGRSLVPLLLLSLAACAAHDKAGDKAAALGDWKAAVAEYRQAVADKPDDPALKQKLAEARGQALAESAGKAQACRVQGQWDCVLAETDFALSLDPTSVALASQRQEAAHAVARSKVAQAEDQLARGALGPASQLLGEARQLSQARDVDEAARGAERRWVAAARPEVERLRAARRYQEAVALATTAAGYDPAVRPYLDALNREYEGFRGAEHDRLVAEGQQALDRGAWADAAARFKAAQAARPDDRARAAERYAGLAQQGDQAVERGDYRAAARAYQDAVALQVERNGYAAAQLARVAIRPWAVRIRGVLVDPARPDGTPWIGPPSAALNRAGRELARLGGGKVDGPVLLAVNAVPRDNRPALLVEVVLPDGRRLVAPAQYGPYLTLDAGVVVAANGFDRRQLVVRVVHQEPGGPAEPVGEVRVTIGDLIARDHGTLSAPPVLGVELSASPADGMTEGSSTGLQPVAEAAQPVRAPGAPALPLRPAVPGAR
jgi:tetratricopeptide (TPR) repeat protein